MKLVCATFFLLACLAVASARLCETENDCREGECCAAILGIQVYNRGICLRLNREGRRCREPESKLEYFGGKFMGYCPCQEGLSCEPNPPRGNRDPPRFRLTFTCQGTTSTSSPGTTSTISPGTTSTTSPGTTSTTNLETTAPTTGTSTTEIPTTD
ncbi:integumentary mucin C.1-like [Stegodyphus dumicola]|uniref:integumentary mucin C.1-like n=1 Tax=Stegodyphus dumicola TaxID=202533 RepID=UPI0015A8074B|nr:integumentary mucin C.1-like [Stegodyphus dumicola]